MGLAEGEGEGAGADAGAGAGAGARTCEPATRRLSAVLLLRAGLAAGSRGLRTIFLRSSGRSRWKHGWCHWPVPTFLKWYAFSARTHEAYWECRKKSGRMSDARRSGFLIVILEPSADQPMSSYPAFTISHVQETKSAAPCSAGLRGSTAGAGGGNGMLEAGASAKTCVSIWASVSTRLGRARWLHGRGRGRLAGPHAGKKASAELAGRAFLISR